MADAFRGLTIRLGADARPLKSAIDSITYSSSQAQKQLNAMNKALKFDGNNIQAMSAKLNLAGDRATMTARAIRYIKTAIEQASDSAKQLEGSTSGVYAKTEKLRSEYNSVNRQLARIYEAAAKVKQEQDGITFAKALKAIKGFAKEMDGVGEESRKARAELEAYVRQAHQLHGAGDAYGLKNTYADSKKLIQILDRLRASHKNLQVELENAKGAEGLSAMKVQLLAYEMEARQAAAETVELRSKMQSIGSTTIAGILSETQRLDSYLDEATASARKMEEVFKKVPSSIEAGRLKMQSMANAQDTLNAKIKSYEALVDQIEAESPFVKQAAAARNVYTWLAKSTANAEKYEMAVKDAEQAVEKVKEDMKAAAAASGKGSDAVKALVPSLREAEVKLEAVKGQARAANAELEKANKTRSYVQARQDLAAFRAEAVSAEKAASRVRRALDFASNIRTAGYGLYSTLTPAIMIAGSYAMQSAEDIDKAYRDMRKTVNGTEEEFVALKDAALDFSATHYTSADTILEIEAMGGQLGIEAKNLEAFAEAVSNLEIATDIEAEDMAKYIGQLSNIMDDIDQSSPAKYQQQVTSFSDALVRLGNNSAAQESSIMKVMMRIASLGTISGFTTPQLLAISTAVAATGQGCEAAGTAISRTFSNIQAAVSAGGEDLENFAAVTDLTAEQFAEAWNNDPMKAFDAFIGGLRKIKDAGGDVDGTLAKLGINSVRQKQALEGLTNTYDVLTQSIGMANDAWNGQATDMGGGVLEEAGDAAREAQRKSEGFSGELQKMRNNAQMLASELAEGAIPIIKALGAGFQGLTAMFKSMPSGVKTAAVAIAGIAAAIGPVMVGFGALGAFIDKAMDAAAAVAGSKTLKNIMNLDNAVKGASIQTGLLGRAARAVSPAVAAIGAGPIIAGVAALAAVIGQVASYSIEATTRGNNLRKATTGYADAVRNAKGANDILGVGMKDSSSTLERLVANYGKNAAAAETLTSKNMALAQSFAEQEMGAQTTAGLIQRYSDTIIELAGHCEGDARKVATLKNAISKYNELTGSNIQMINDFSGAIDHQTEAIEKNTEAAKLNAYAKAYQEMLAEGVKAEEETKIALENASQSYADATSEIDKLTAAGKAYNAEGTPTDELLQAQAAATEATNTISELTPQLDGLREGNELLEQKLGDVQAAADGSTSAYNRLKYGVMDYEKALRDSGIAFDEFINAANGCGMQLADFAQELSGAGISAQEFANLGAAGFGQLLAAANNDFSQIRLAMDLLNMAQINPKEMTVTENGIEDATGKLWTLDLAAQTITNGETTLSINADTSGAQASLQATEAQADATGAAIDEIPDEGSINYDDTSLEEAEAQAGETSTAINDIPESKDISVNVYGNAQGVLQDIVNKLGAIQSKEVTVTTNEVTVKHAAGGISSSAVRAIPRNASGGINGIVTRATLTNVGWVGEAGDEAVFHMRHAGGAIVPLSNRSKVRPFAGAVAAEMSRYTPAQTFEADAIISEIQALNENIKNLKLYIDGRKLVGGIADEMDMKLSRMQVAYGR